MKKKFKDCPALGVILYIENVKPFCKTTIWDDLLLVNK